MARLPKAKEAKLESREEAEESDEEYDVSSCSGLVSQRSTDQLYSMTQPAKDDFLVGLAARMGGPLAELEKRLQGLERVEMIVNEGERAIVGMM